MLDTYLQVPVNYVLKARKSSKDPSQILMTSARVENYFHQPFKGFQKFFSCAPHLKLKTDLAHIRFFLLYLHIRCLQQQVKHMFPLKSSVFKANRASFILFVLFGFLLLPSCLSSSSLPVAILYFPLFSLSFQSFRFPSRLFLIFLLHASLNNLIHNISVKASQTSMKISGNLLGGIPR